MTIIDFLEKNAKEYGENKSLVELSPVDEKTHINEKHILDVQLVEPLMNSNKTNSMQFVNGFQRRCMSWREFNELSNRIANMLISDGVKKGDHIAIVMANSLEWLPVLFGILKTGAVAVPMNTFLKNAEAVEKYFELADVKRVFFDKNVGERMREVGNRFEDVKMYIVEPKQEREATRFNFAININDLLPLCNPNNPKVEINENDNAIIFFTSGTTGNSKAVMHTHFSVMSAGQVEQMHHGQNENDNFLCMPPLFHTGATIHWLGSLLSGSSAVLLRKVTSENIIKTIDNEKITLAFMLRPWAIDLFKEIDSGNIDLNKYDLSSCRLTHFGAQPIEPQVLEKWRALFPNQKLDVNYGLTESCGPGCVHLGTESDISVMSLGKVGYGWTAKIVDVNDPTKELEDGKIGELCVKGNSTMKEYYKNKEQTEKTLINGFIHTGDLATKNGDEVFLKGRIKELIIVGGENISPVEVENIMMANAELSKKIKDIAIVKKQDERLGEVPIAVVEKIAGADITKEEINSICKTILNGAMRPHGIVFDKIKFNQMGKKDRIAMENEVAEMQV